jgi:hypothetical protein
MKKIESLGIRRQGIILSFNAFKAKFGFYPNIPEDLLEVSTTKLSDASFYKYRKWFFEFTGEKEK